MVTQSTVWSLGVVFGLPRREFHPCVVEREKPVLVEKLLTEPRVERFDKSIVGRSSGSTEIKVDFVPVCPAIKVLRDELWSVVYLDPLGEAMGTSYAFQRRYNIQSSDLRACIQSQTFACVILKDNQNTEPSFVEESIGDEVHAPAFVSSLGTRPDLPLHAGNTPAGEFSSHYKAFFAVEAVDPLVVDLPSLTPQEDVEPAIAIGDSDSGKLSQTEAQRQLRIGCASVTMCRPWPSEHPKGPPFARLIHGLHLPDQCSTKGGP